VEPDEREGGGREKRASSPRNVHLPKVLKVALTRDGIHEKEQVRAEKDQRG